MAKKKALNKEETFAALDNMTKAGIDIAALADATTSKEFEAAVNKQAELDAMQNATLSMLGKIVGGPVTVQWMEDDGTVTGEMKPSPEVVAEIEAAVASENPKVEVMSPEKQGLVANSVLMRIGFGVFGNSKKAYVDVKTEAEQSRFKVHKTLLNSPELKAINKADLKIRQFIYKESIPFDMGSVLLSYAKLDFVIGVLDNYIEVERPALVAALVKAYPEQVAQAEQDLGPEFRPNEFPPVQEVAAQFTCSYKLMGFDVPGELAGINKAVYQAQVAKAKAQVADVTNEIQQAQRAILFSLVDNLAYKLMPDESGKSRVINPGAVTKLQKFIQDFEFNNVTGDSEAQKLIGQLKALTDGASPETFKTDAELKAATAEKLMNIQDSLEGLLEIKPERKYKDLGDEEATA
jgi:hypothetical protein